MAGFLKFVFVLLMGVAGLVAAWYFLTDRAVALPDVSQAADIETWRPYTLHAAGLGAGLLLGLILAALIPKKNRQPKRTAASDRLAAAVMAAVTPPNSPAGYGLMTEKAAVIQRVIASSPSAAQQIAAGNLEQGLAALERSARAAKARGGPLWRDLGLLLIGVEGERALTAFRETARLGLADFWASLFLSRLEHSVAKDDAASRAALEAAFQCARSRREQAYALLDRGQALTRAKQPDPAASAFHQAAEMARQFHESNPSDGEPKWLLATCLQQVALRAQQAGELDKALALYGEVVDLRRALLVSDLDPVDAQAALAAALMVFGNASQRAGDKAAAKTAQAEALELRREVLAARPEQPDAIRSFAHSCYALGNLTGEQAYWSEAITNLEHLAAAAPLSPADAKLLDEVRAKAGN